jgi:hypothetical protein
LKTKTYKIGELLELTENTWGIDIQEARVVKAGKLTFDKFATNKSKGQEMAYKDLEIEDDTAKCVLRVKTGAVSNEYISSIKAESRIKLVNVGWLINQTRLTTMKSRFAASDIMLDDEIDK